ncbi:hypothetical protein HDU76_004314 [Blyttiomyces sp. JEL0837]|nr:hypothetical protein HDU76_004314 [Blyttiomyces sp. JEL0837]
MVQFHIASEAYQKLVLHAAKYSVTSVTGLLVGTKTGTKVEITEVEIYTHQNGLKIVGIYVANELVNDMTIPPHIAKVGQKIDETLGGDSAVVVVDNAKLNGSDLALQPYHYSAGSWKLLGSSRTYEQLYDFDNHLDNVQLNWLKNPAVTALLTAK